MSDQPAHDATAARLAREVSAEYAAAYLAMHAADAAYLPIRDAYRAGTIDDTTFLAARAVWTAAEAEFDAAFAAAQ